MTNGVEEFEPYDKETRYKEIDLVQAQITRMSNLGMTVKGMSVTITGFLFAVISKEAIDTNLIMILVLWIVSIVALKTCKKFDFNYLRTENIYRVWFDFLINNRHKNNAGLFELNPVKILAIANGELLTREDYQTSFIDNRTKNSWAIKPFYNGLMTIISVVYFLLIIEHIYYLYNCQIVNYLFALLNAVSIQ